MTDRLAIALAQIDPAVGDVRGNADRIRDARAEAAARDADLVVLPELALSGCPAEGLAAKPFFLAAVRTEVERLAAETADGGPALLVGAPWIEGGRVFDAALLLERGRIAAVRYRHEPADGDLPEAGGGFHPGPVPGPVNFRDVRLGVLVGADIATPDVAEALGECGAEILLAPGAGPFDTQAMDRRLNLAVARVTETELPLVCVNAVGGQDGLVFDGGSFALGADRALVAQAARWREQVVITRWQRGDAGWTCVHGEIARPDDGLESVYRAMVLGLGDHVRKNGFPGVLIGLS
ncbi:MAG TPA: nitrilase-related carbon-nitrogen hydrolase, partial [Arenibaculum sp.]|nr:nitrilase-related carbon-nitrogen hydrolase [Arenibaculum sp.]